MDRSEVFSIAGSYFYFFLSTFSCLNFKKRRDCGTAFGYHFASEKWYSRRFSAPADYHIVIECSLREVISGKSQRIIEEAVFLTPPAFRILFNGSSRVFAVEQFGIWHWKANGKTNLMKKLTKNRTSTAWDFAKYVWPNPNLEEKPSHYFRLFVFFLPYLREFLQ